MSGKSDFFDMLGVKASIDIKTYEKDIKAKDKEIERLNNIIKEVRDFVESMEYCGQEDYFYDLKAEDECGNDNTFNDSKYKLLEILKGE